MTRRSTRFGKRREGESLHEYLSRHHALPGDPLNPGITDEQAIRDGILPPADHPIYGEEMGLGLGIEIGVAPPEEEEADYYAIGEDPGTNLLKRVPGIMYLLNDAFDWEIDMSAIRFLMGEPETRKVKVEEARQIYVRISGGRRWPPRESM